MRHLVLGSLAAAALGLGLTGGTALASEFTLGAGFTPDPQTARGATGGPVDASARFGGECTGSIGRTPDHIINVTSNVDLRLYTVTDVDSTLVLTGPAGTFCDDDSGDSLLDAEINATLTPGRYEVYIGHLGEGGSYTLTLTENLGGGRGDEEVERYRDFTLGAGFTPDPQRGAGLTGGTRNASSYGKNCTGMIDTSPDHRLTVTSTVNLRIYVESSTDASLVIVGPNRTWCDDDSHGALDPEINATFAPGEYQIFVGHIGSSGEYTITLTENL